MLARRALPRLQQPFGQYARRPFSTTELSNGIKMAYDFHEPEKGQSAEGPPIVFVHGLFGSKRNHRAISKYGHLTVVHSSWEIKVDAEHSSAT